MNGLVRTIWCQVRLKTAINLPLKVSIRATIRIVAPHIMTVSLLEKSDS